MDDRAKDVHFLLVHPSRPRLLDHVTTLPVVLDVNNHGPVHALHDVTCIQRSDQGIEAETENVKETPIRGTRRKEKTSIVRKVMEKSDEAF